MSFIEEINALIQLEGTMHNWDFEVEKDSEDQMKENHEDYWNSKENFVHNSRYNEKGTWDGSLGFFKMFWNNYNINHRSKVMNLRYGRN